jgi:hypothetical protein
VESHPRRIKKVYISEKIAGDFKEMRPKDNGPRINEIVEIRGKKDLDSLIPDLWPTLISMVK